MSTRIAVVGGGPGGLFFAALMKRRMPTAEVVLFERNRPDNIWGFGVVFSDGTLRTITDAHPVLRDAISDVGTHWDEIQVWAQGQHHSFAGNGMSAIHRRHLLNALHTLANETEVDLRFETPVENLSELSDFDLIVAADGANSRLRQQVGEDVLGHTVEQADMKFIWFGTRHVFDGLTFVHRQNEHGSFAAHAYPIADDLSTFIVEADEQTWRNAGLNELDGRLNPGQSDIKTKEYLEELFSEDIEGAQIVVNNSKWANFRTRRTQNWYHENVVFLGDSIHTAHFSVGSGTKMAMEDAIVLAEQVATHPDDIPSALYAYQDLRKPKVDRVQDAARPSLSWWEHFAFYHNNFNPLQFTFHFFSRSIGREKIATRDPQLVKAIDDWWIQQHGAGPESTPIQIDALTLRSRILKLDRGKISDGVEEISIGSGHVTVIDAPLAEREVTEILPYLPNMGSVVIRGDELVTKRLLAEHARLQKGLTVVMVGPADADTALTTVLSGRADAYAMEV